MKLAVIGSRTFSYYTFMCSVLDQYEITMIISGGARGADTLAEKYAKDHDIPIMTYSADWKRFGRSAGNQRNFQIIDDCDEVVAFWDGESKGTDHSIGYAEQCNKKVRIEWPH